MFAKNLIQNEIIFLLIHMNQVHPMKQRNDIHLDMS